MGIPSRHSGYPYVDGETLSGADLETDIANLVAEAGNVEDANVAAAANISGSKLADATVPNAKLVGSTITTAKMAQSAVPQAYVSTATATGYLSASSAFADVDGITSATLTPGSTSDIIMLDCVIPAHHSSGGASWYDYAFSVNGTDTSALSTHYHSDTNEFPITMVHITWAVAAPATSAIVLKPRHRRFSGSGNPWFHATIPRMFRAVIVPTK